MVVVVKMRGGGGGGKRGRRGRKRRRRSGRESLPKILACCYTVVDIIIISSTLFQVISLGIYCHSGVQIIVHMGKVIAGDPSLFHSVTVINTIGFIEMSLNATRMGLYFNRISLQYGCQYIGPIYSVKREIERDVYKSCEKRVSTKSVDMKICLKGFSGR